MKKRFRRGFLAFLLPLLWTAFGLAQRVADHVEPVQSCFSLFNESVAPLFLPHSLKAIQADNWRPLSDNVSLDDGTFRA